MLNQKGIKVNEFDIENKTPYDRAFNIKDKSTRYDICRIISNAGGVSSEEINNFGNKKEEGSKQIVIQPQKQVVVYYEYKTEFLPDSILPQLQIANLNSEGWEVFSSRRCYQDLNPFRPDKHKVWGYEVQCRRLKKEFY